MKYAWKLISDDYKASNYRGKIAFFVVFLIVPLAIVISENYIFPDNPLADILTFSVIILIALGVIKWSMKN